MVTLMSPPCLGRARGTKRKVVDYKKAMITQTPELIFTKALNPIDFIRMAPKRETRSRTREVKSRRNRRSRTKERLPTSGSQQEYSEEDSLRREVFGIKVPLTIPNSSLLEHVAISRFFHHYVSPTRTFCRLDLDFTSFIIDNATMRSTLSEIIIALGILTLPRKTDAAQMAARLRYTRALRLTNQALRDDQEVKSDEILMAVILLSFFETTPDDAHSMTSWTAHLDGARMLLRIRGLEMLRRHPTYRMFSMLRQQILINCLMSAQPVPQDLLELSTQISVTQDEDERAASQVVGLFARLCNLFAASRTPANIDRKQFLEQAIALDDDLVSWSRLLPPSYECSTVPGTVSDESYTRFYEVYSSLFAAEVWNLYRSARLGVNGIIIEQQTLLTMERSRSGSTWGAEEILAEDAQRPVEGVDTRFAVVESLRNDICSTTPFMLGRNQPSENHPANDIPLFKRTPVVHQLLFLLKTAGITERMSAWVTSKISELQSGDEEVDSGGIWHGNSLNYDSD